MTAAAWVGLLGVIVATWGVITQRLIARRKATIDHLLRVDTDNDLIKARELFIALTKDPGGLAIWAEPENYGTDQAEAIRLTLNESERVAIGLQFGILDLAFVKRHSKGTLLKDWELALPFIAQLRLRTGNPALYRDFEILVAELEGRRSSRLQSWRRLLT